ncbi:hypothetical protein CHS0354_011624 [Potamilus streckersoni]|uniref:Uncharacterized protein n=1 Tax=Potamilus streckersoni TaxID=2493646 RepID=A0AAE0TKF2_9BIVA|nr:hypothetical protein CHS0354_011624 [Potamilus streckersoni]
MDNNQIFKMDDRTDWRRTNLHEVFSSGGITKQRPTQSPKKRPAPAPPSARIQLPKIGNYVPKMLIENKSHEYSSSVIKTKGPTLNTIQDPPPAKMNFIIMGDKNVPLLIENTGNETEEDLPVPKPRKKRQAPMNPREEPDVLKLESKREMETFPNDRHRPYDNKTKTYRDSPEIINDIILAPPASFSPTQTLESAEIETVLAGNTKINPLFGAPVNGTHLVIQPPAEFMDTSSPSEITANIEGSRRMESIHNEISANEISNGYEYPYIPPPDYDEEEKTMTFEDEEDNDRHYHMNRANEIFKQMQEDDFGKYISNEEDYEFDSLPVTSRRMKMTQPMSNQHQKRKSAVPTPSKPDSLFKTPKKPKEGLYQRSTIRDFTYSDSKIGWGDRTVRSTSAKGRYIKREKGRKKLSDQQYVEQQTSNTYEEFLNTRQMGDYENFLHAKSKSLNNLESPNSSDSGHETSDDAYRESVYYNSQPKELLDKNIDSKSTFWKKLTWKFKRNFGVQQLGNR